jgi:hypothetical protein
MLANKKPSNQDANTIPIREEKKGLRRSHIA